MKKTVLTALVWLLPTLASAQTIFTVGDETALRTALTSAASGDSIVFTSNITLATGDLPNVNTDLTIDGQGHALSGNNQYRGLFVAGFDIMSLPVPVSVTIQNLTIQNTLAAGGKGGDGTGGGGGGAGLGGGLYIGDFASVTVSNVTLSGTAAVGGNGGAGGSAVGSGGGGGGLGGAGGAATAGPGGGGGGGGGLGNGATGADGGLNSSTSGIITGVTSGGGDGGSATFSPIAGTPGGVPSIGLGGGGGGATGPAFASNGSFGGGGGGDSGAGSGLAGNGGFGGGGGGTDATGTPGGSLFGGGIGDASGTGGGGGGGAGLGGAIFVSGLGTLTIGGSLSINGASVSGGAGGSVGAGSGSAFGSGLYIKSDVAFTPSAAQTVTIAGDIADAGGSAISMIGAGKLILSGNNTFAGGLNIAAGTVSVAADANLGLSGALVAIGSGATLEITGTDVFTRFLGLVPGSATVSVTGGHVATWTGQIAEPLCVCPAALYLAGGGVFALANNSVGLTQNIFSSGLFVTGNTEALVTTDAALGAGNTAVSLGDSTSSGTLGISSANLTSTRAIALGAGGGTVDTIGSATIATLSGVISGTGALTKTGDGTLTLSGNNTYSGSTIVNQGKLIAGSANAFGTGKFLTVNSSGIADFNAFNQNFYSVTGNGTVALSGGAFLTIGADNSSSSFDGSLTGTGSLIKSGAGTLTLGGTNTFTGGINLNAGALSISSDANLGGAGTLAMAASTALNITAGGLYAHNLSLSSGTSINGSAGTAVTLSGAISGTGPLKWTGAGSQLVLTNTANSYSGGTIIGGGATLALGSNTALGAAGTGLTIGDASGPATLQATGSFTLARPITLGSQVTFATPDGGTNLNVTGTIDGSGGLTKTGAGGLILSGTTTYAGPTVLLGGRLTLGRPLSATGALALNSGTTFDFNGFSASMNSLSGSGTILLGGATLSLGGDGSSSLFAGSVQGAGSLVKNGGGTLQITGTNTFTGGWRVNGGTLLGNTTSLSGNVLNNALVVFDQGSNGTYAGNMSGSGGLVKTGAGLLTLSGTNSYSGGTLLSAGSLIGTTNSLQGGIINNGNLVFDQATDAIFNGFITGAGTLTKQGGGFVTLNGLNTFTGLTSVLNGTLGLDAGLPGSVNVGALAGLRGAGVIGGSLNLGGTLTIPAPGTSLATFNSQRLGLAAAESNQAPSLFINGDFTTTQGSILNMAVSPGGAPPVIVGGKALLQGTALNVTINDPNPARHATYVGLSAANGLTLSGVTATSPTRGLIPIVRGDPTALVVTLLNLEAPLAPVATSESGSSVARALDKVKVGATGDFGAVIRELAALDDSRINSALKNLSGEIHASTTRLTSIVSRGVSDLVRDEVSTAEHDAEDDGGAGGSQRTRAAGRTLRPWLRFSADHATFDSNGSTGTANTASPAGGVDFKPSSGIMLGGGLALGVGGMSLSDVSGSSKITAPHAFAYSGIGLGPFHLHAGGSGSVQKTSTQRDIQFAALVPNEKGELVPLTPGGVNSPAFFRRVVPGQDAALPASPELPAPGVDRNATSDQSTTTRDGWTEVQETYKHWGWVIDNKISVRVSQQDRDAFAESGGGSISLAAARELLKSREGTFEGHYFRKAGNWRPNVLVSYTRQFVDDPSATNVSFEGNPSAEFPVQGAQVPVTLFHGLFGLTVRTFTGLEYTLEYETQKGPGESHHSVHFRVKFR